MARLRFRILFAATVLLQTAAVFAQGNLLITPRRVVFEGSKRSMDLNLANVGKDSAEYTISIIQIKMNEDGSTQNIEKPDSGQRFADRYIRFFPRLVKLGPNESQMIKVQLVRTGELTEGEYRSHFYFRSERNNAPLGDNKDVDSTTISVKLVPVFGITIPVIVRSGINNTKVTVSDLQLSWITESEPKLSMVFYRDGNMSVYGDVVIDHVSTSGVTTRVGIANGLAVYTPNKKRQFSLKLNTGKGVNYRSGKLVVSYNAPSDVKPAKYAAAELILK
jgi:hypothetical protein